jgi:HEAT repeat protein
MSRVFLCSSLVVLLSTAGADDQQVLDDRIQLVHDFPDWQKESLSRAELMECVRQLQSPDRTVQRDALQKLALARPDPRYRDPVFNAARQVRMQHDDKFSRAMLGHINACWSEAEAAARMLERARRSGGIRYLERALQQGNPLEQQQAMAALGYSNEPRAAEIIVAHFKKNSGVASRSLAIIGPPAAPATLQLLDDADWVTRQDALEVLAKIGSESEIPRIEELSSDSNGVVKIQVARTLEAIRRRN